MRITRDELEYAISQYLDGVLPPLERAALEERLAGDADARAVLEDYRALDAAIRSNSVEPLVKWDQFSARLGQALAQQEAPVRHYSMRAAWPMRIAIAAVLLLAVGISFRMIQNSPSTVQQPAGVAMVSGPAVEQLTGTVVAQVQIGPAPSVAMISPAEDDIVVRPTVVLIDPANNSGQDNDLY